MAHTIKLENFTRDDFNKLISWIDNEKDLVQFAGPLFSFPLTIEQLNDYVNDSNRHSFKIVLSESNISIGHCEAYQTDTSNVRLCRIIIGDKNYRGQGLGYAATAMLVDWCIENLNIKTIDLNVYEFNTPAIKCYEKLGFQKTDEKKITEFCGEKWTAIKMTLKLKNQSNKPL